MRSILRFSRFLSQLNLDWSKVVVDTLNKADMPTAASLDARRFLRFGYEDLTERGVKGSANALSHAKRALECQVDRILLAVGLRKDRVSFPAKLETLQEIGMISPGILRKVSKRRNLLEHEYRLPTFEEAEDALDTASLFLDATDHVLAHFPHDVAIGNVDMRDPSWDAEWMDPVFTIRFTPSTAQVKVVAGNMRGRNGWRSRVSVKPENSEYRSLLRLGVSLRRGHGIDESLRIISANSDAKAYAVFVM